jgi:putative tryptophan/tyrosine transport system substrate-binding protein
VKRREFITLVGGAAVAAWPLAARAQQPERMRTIAWFGLGRADVPSPYLDALRSGLRERGWIEGRNLTISAYWATGQQEMDAVGHTLAASNPEVIVTQELTINAVLNIAAPVVFGISGNPVDAKFVESFARPGGNRTGVSYLAIDLGAKRIELLKEWVPQVRHVAVLARPQHPGEHPRASGYAGSCRQARHAAFLFSDAGPDGNGRDFPRRPPGPLRRTGCFSRCGDVRSQ